MSLIICPECGKQISDRASTCPHCGYPISSSAEVDMATNIPAYTNIPLKTSKNRTLIKLVAVIVVIAITIGACIWLIIPRVRLEKAYSEALEMYNTGEYIDAIPHLESLGGYKNSADVLTWCKYELARNYISNREWENATLYLAGLNYDQSEPMLTDCSFMVALQNSVLRRMEMNAKESSDYRSLVTTELAYLEDFRSADFYDSTIRAQAQKYIDGLDKQLAGLSYDFYYEYQRDWNTGLVARYEALAKLYNDYQFMADNKDFVGTYINQVEYYQKWLKAFKTMEADGHVDLSWNYAWNYVEIRFKNDTPYTSSQVFDIMFYGDEKETKYLGTTSVVVNDIAPYSEYTVRAYYTKGAQQAYYSSGLWVHWSNYYQDIKTN